MKKFAFQLFPDFLINKKVNNLDDSSGGDSASCRLPTQQKQHPLNMVGS